ncbi:MAG: DUF3656 domain-containing U32 family peptidase [Bacillota bacterium]
MKLELLAPAGEWKALVAAISSGADAVYLGLPKFSARAGAQNFTWPELEKGIRLAHLHGRKIYLAVNTLIREEEMKEALEAVKKACEMSIDALILQDLGFFSLVKTNFPGLPLHASTQMTVHNRDGALWLKKMGFARVILARELSKQEISDIAGVPDLEVEVFVHGALCICYSGQCLMSSMVGGRSGNRGRCAQPCRLEYRLGGASGYYLSPRDLNLLAHLPELASAGVRSLKIEGRMKRPEYVWVVADIYHRALEFLEEKAGLEEMPEIWQKRLTQIFNRDFTPGYFTGYPGADLMSFQRPNNRGTYVGRVISTDPQRKRIGVKVEKELRAGDGIEIWVTRGGRLGGELSRLWQAGQEVDGLNAGATGEFWFDGPARPGDRIFKTFDCVLMEEARARCNEDALKVPLSFFLRIAAGEQIILKIEDDLGNTVECRSPHQPEIAVKRAVTEDVVREQLGRLGGTPFVLKDLCADIKDRVMIPLSVLNELRRRGIREVTEVRLRKLGFPACRDAAAIKFPDIFNPSKNSVPLLRLGIRVGEFSALRRMLPLKPAYIYFGFETYAPGFWDADTLREGIELCRKSHIQPVLTTPVIMKDSDMAAVAGILKRLSGESSFSVRVGNIGLLERLRVFPHPLCLDFALNIFNPYSVQRFLQENKGIFQIALSPELNEKQAARLAGHFPGLSWEFFAQGRINLMISEYCPYHATAVGAGGKKNCPHVCRKERWEMEDALGYKFPLYMDEFCRLHLLNSVEHCLLGELARIRAWSVPVTLYIEGRPYPPELLAEIVRAYQEAIRRLAQGKPADAGPRDIYGNKGEGKYTKGHFYRGVS